jgi:predicted RNase H-like nuclease (RuvC/YqgF family)
MSDDHSVEYWKRAAEEAEKLCLEQMELLRQAQVSIAADRDALQIQGQTITSQQAELAELRRNLERSTQLIQSLEQRVGRLQTFLDSQPTSSPQVSELEMQITELQHQVEVEANQTRTSQVQLARAQERLILLERQVLQLRSLIERFSKQPVMQGGDDSPLPRPSMGHVQLPPFLQD